jgi:hypothetical protein
MGLEDIDALRVSRRAWLTIALRISPADLTPPWPAGTAVRCPKIDPHDPQRLQQPPFPAHCREFDGGKYASKTSCLEWRKQLSSGS